MLNFDSMHAVPRQAINATISSFIDPVVGKAYNRICNVSKLPGLTSTPTAQWMKVDGDDGERIMLSEQSTSTLNFTPLRTSNAGQYRCQGNINTTVSDTPLSDSSDFNLTVTSKILTVLLFV